MKHFDIKKEALLHDFNDIDMECISKNEPNDSYKSLIVILEITIETHNKTS